MSEPYIQADYDQLRQIAARFGRQAEEIASLQQLLRRRAETLRSRGWRGTGATAFYAEMDSNVLPALARLSAALEAAQETTGQISATMRQAEESAARLFVSEPYVGAHEFGPATESPSDLAERFRQRQAAGRGPVAAAVVGVLPLAGGAALADGPLPFGELVALGLIGIAAIGGLILLAEMENRPAPNVDREKVDRVLGEAEAATGDVTSGDIVNADEALEILGDWLGEYDEVAPDVFRSKEPNADGTYNQGRLDNGSLEGRNSPLGPHISNSGRHNLRKETREVW